MALAPLSELYNKNNFAMLKYPSDLGTARKGHLITFTISVPTKSSYNKTNIPTTLNNTTGTSILTAANNAFNTIIQALSSVGSSITSYGMNGASGAYNAPIPDLWEYTVTPGTTKPVSTIQLYMPDTVSVAQHQYYIAESLTEASGVAGQIAAGVVGATDIIKNGGDFSTILRNMATEGAIGSLTGKDALVRAGLKAVGSAVNPQMEVFFRDIDFRTFQFDFLFTTKNQKEAEEVSSIIQAFKFHAAPELDRNNSNGGRYYIVPSVFEIQAYYIDVNGNQVENGNVNKYGVCACETVNVDYAPQGWVTHEDGMPVQTRLTLQFKEMEILTKEKITQGY